MLLVVSPGVSESVDRVPKVGLWVGRKLSKFRCGSLEISNIRSGRAASWAKLNGRARKRGNQASGFLPVTQIQPLLRSSKTSTAV
jgi:hypothetical protein